MPRPAKPTKAATPLKKPVAAKKQASPAKATSAKKAAPSRSAPAKKQAPAKTAPSKKQAPVKKPSPTKAAAPKPTAPKPTAPKATTTKATTTKATTTKAPAKAPAKAAPVPKQAAGKVAAAKTPAKPASKTAAPVKEAPAKAAAPAKPPAPKKSPFDAKFLEAQKELLLEERATYVAQAEALKAEADQLAAEMEPGDVQFDEESGEGGTANVDRERDLALSAQARVTVEEIDHALAKIKANTYGLCESCGQAIMKARLQAIPHAQLCVACKSGGLSRR
jgi:RNA polymerase-binding transcription factor DksA